MKIVGVENNFSSEIPELLDFCKSNDGVYYQLELYLSVFS